MPAARSSTRVASPFEPVAICAILRSTVLTFVATGRQSQDSAEVAPGFEVTTGAFADEYPASEVGFWGIEQFTTPGGKRLLAASDRDHGLYLFEYTGK